MTWLLRTFARRTWRRIQCQHLGARTDIGLPFPGRPPWGVALCTRCGTWLATPPETIHTLAGRRRR